MQRTLFYIGPDFLGFPVFGFPSWSLIAWIVCCVVTALAMLRRGHGAAVIAGLPSMIVVALVLGFLLPHMQVVEDGQNLGIAIRGYGVMMLLAILVGLSTAVYRARQVQLSSELIYSMAIWMVVCGIVGARLFFVIQKWEQFASDDWRTVAMDVLNLAQGGLVVYGSLIGGLVGMGIFLYRNRLPILPICDVIAASMLFGLAVGRMGCLMNGCCYGGHCEHWWAVTFPADSPPYLDQLQAGTLHGFHWHINDQGRVQVDQVVPGSAAEAAGLRVDDVILSVEGIRLASDNVETRSTDRAARDENPELAWHMQRRLMEAGEVIRVDMLDGRTVAWEVALPGRSLPVHPTQVYSAVNALLLGLVLWCLYPLRRRDGQVFAVLLTLYPITRFLLEIIRVDEGSFAGTGLTISQNVSLVLTAAGVALWWYLARRPTDQLWRGPAAAPRSCIAMS